MEKERRHVFSAVTHVNENLGIVVNKLEKGMDIEKQQELAIEVEELRDILKGLQNMLF